MVLFIQNLELEFLISACSVNVSGVVGIQLLQPGIEEQEVWPTERQDKIRVVNYFETDYY